MFTTRPTLQGTFGMASSSHWLASQSAMAVLENGGNAFDAAVAAAFVLHVVQPHLNGPAGEVNIIFAPVSAHVRVLCGQGPAPAGAAIEHFTALGLDAVPATGSLAAAVPGAFDAWMLLLRDYGTKSLEEVLAHAVGYAAHGHPPGDGIATAVESVRELFLGEWPSSAEIYLPRGKPPEAGRLMTNQPLADTWRRLIAEATAAGGGRERQIEAARRVWREGFIAASLADFSTKEVLDTSGERHAGVLSGDDLACWSASYEQPLTYEWDGWTVSKAGPWCQGPAFLQQLALLSPRMDYGTPDFVHTVVESTKLAMADREAWYGDSAPVPLDDLLSPDYNHGRRELITACASTELRPGSPGGRAPRLPRHAASAAWTPAVPVMDSVPGEPVTTRTGAVRGDTCHLDVVDRWGNMIAATPSGGWLQSNPVVPGLGFPLGTRLQMAWLDPGLANSLTPGRRPRTTLSPSLASCDGRAVLAFGTPGGDQQDQWSLHFFLAVALREPAHGGIDLQGAIDAPHWHTDGFPSSFAPHASQPGSLAVESSIRDFVIADLRARGHDVTVLPPWAEGGMCAVARDPQTGILSAAATPRGMRAYAVGR